MISVSHFVPEDVALIKPRSFYVTNDEFWERIKLVSSIKGNPVYTVWRDSFTALAIVGATMMYPGVAETWSVTSEEIKKTPHSFHEVVLRLLNIVWQTKELHRMQSFVQCDYTEGQRWLEGLKFTQEARMSKFGSDKSDYFMYARLS